MKRAKTKRIIRRPAKRSKPNHFGRYVPLLGILVLLIGLFVTLFAAQNRQYQRSQAAPSAELQTDRLNQSFTGAGYTSEYHIFAAGLDWTKPVGLLMYTDGSGESGLKSPTSDYLMAGSTGMIAVAKKHNMVLVTPFSPNKACSDGDGSCWYDGDSPGYTKWAEALITQIESQYQIDKRRVAVGGYSSGATFTTGWWVPSGAAQNTMDDGVIVAISYGGGPYMKEVAYTPAFKTNIHMNWNGGDADESITEVREGNANYTKAGFQTSLDVLPGVTHDRSGEFGPIMDAMITKHVPPATGTAPTSSGPTAVPTFFCGGSNSCVPTGSQPQSTIVPGTNPLPTRVTPDTPVSSTDPTIALDPQPTSIGQNPSLPNPAESKGGNTNKGLLAVLLAFILEILKFFASLFNQ